MSPILRRYSDDELQQARERAGTRASLSGFVHAIGRFVELAHVQGTRLVDVLDRWATVAERQAAAVERQAAATERLARAIEGNPTEEEDNGTENTDGRGGDRAGESG